MTRENTARTLLSNNTRTWSSEVGGGRLSPGKQADGEGASRDCAQSGSGTQLGLHRAPGGREVLG